MKGSPLLKNTGSWLFVASVIIVLIIAAAAGLHYFKDNIK
jgi:hypothetical protein